MYSDYWNLTKPPFDNVPDASMYVDCHESMENVIAETIYAIKEGNECLTVIVGEVGLGKTLSLRVIIDSLEPERYKVALITNPALSFVQLLKEIIGQITGKQCEIKNKVDLQEKFNRLLFETADQGKKIVIVIDEANVLSTSNLDDLRLLTNMQDDDRNLFTLLLVGQMEFAQTLEHPKRANLFQRIGTYGHLEKLPSEEAVKTYIEARLKIAGTERKIFDDDAIPVIWEFSEHGVPRLINKICKLCIKAGETNEFESISGEIAVQIADRFQKLSKTSLKKHKPQTRPEAEPSGESIEEPETEKTPRASVPKKEAPKTEVPSAPIPPQREEARPVRQRMEMPGQPPARPIPTQQEEARPVRPRMEMPGQPPARPIPPQREEDRSVPTGMNMPKQPPAVPIPPQWEEDRPGPAGIEMQDQPSAESIPSQWEEARPVQSGIATQELPSAESIPSQWEEDRPGPAGIEMQEQPSAESIPSQWEEDRPVPPGIEMQEQPSVAPIPPQWKARPVPPRIDMPGQPPSAASVPPQRETRPVPPKTVPLAKLSTNYVPIQGVPLARTSASNIPPRREESKPVGPRMAMPQPPEAPIPPQRESRPVETKQKEMEEQPIQAEEEVYEDVLIGKQKIKLAIPANTIRQAQSASAENKNKLAGYWSAQILKGNPQMMHASISDPVAIWFEVKNVILKKFNST
jgi:type II secretory pathway predicted ATPase ExeA